MRRRDWHGRVRPLPAHPSLPHHPRMDAGLRVAIGLAFAFRVSDNVRTGSAHDLRSVGVDPSSRHVPAATKGWHHRCSMWRPGGHLVQSTDERHRDDGI